MSHLIGLTDCLIVFLHHLQDASHVGIATNLFALLSNSHSNVAMYVGGVLRHSTLHATPCNKIHMWMRALISSFSSSAVDSLTFVNSDVCELLMHYQINEVRAAQYHLGIRTLFRTEERRVY